MRIKATVFTNTLMYQSENSMLSSIVIVFLRYMADAIEHSEDTEEDTWDFTDTVYDEL